MSSTWKSLKPLTEFKKELDEKNQQLRAKGVVNAADENRLIELAVKLRNSVVKVAARPVYPYIVLQNEIGADGENRTILTGFVGDIWRVLEERFGFETDLILITRNMSYSSKTWDVLLNPKEFSSVKRKDTRSTFPITKIWFHLFLKGKHEATISWYYFRILNKTLWAGISAVIVALSICLWIVWKIRAAMLMKSQGTKGDTNYSTCLLSVLGCMINQGTQFKNDSTSSIRIITLASITLGLLITTSFSALLISKLATVDYVRAERISMKSLLKNPGDKELCVAKSGYAYKKIQDYLKDRTTALKLNGPRCTKGNFDFVPTQDLCSDNTVSLETRSNVDHALDLDPNWNDEKCPVFVNVQRHFITHLTLTVKNDFPYLKLIDRHLLRMEESGLLAKITGKWKPAKRQDNSNLDTASTAPTVTFDHVRSMVLLYATAACVSIFILVLERVYAFFKNRKPLYKLYKLLYLVYGSFGFGES